MYYGKYIDGEFIFAPKKLVIGDVTVFNPTDEQLISVGFKSMIFTDHPTAPNGYQYVDSWEEQPDRLLQVWTMVEVPSEGKTEEQQKAEAFDILIGEQE